MPIPDLTDRGLCTLLDHALAEAAVDQNGFGGNCAEVAAVLNQVLGAGGDYVAVIGEHYEMADHVFLRWKDRLWDIEGSHTVEEAENDWCSEDEDTSLEDFTDPTDDVVARLADQNGVFAGGFDSAVFRDRLVDALTRGGFPLASRPIFAEPSSAGARKSPKP